MGGKGSGRRTGGTQRYDPNDPATWPVAWQKRERKILYMFDILAGGKLDNSPKQEVIDQWLSPSSGSRYHTLRLDHDMLETVADIQAMYRAGGFSRMPLSVAEKIANHYGGNRMPFEIEALDDPSPTSRPWKPSDVVRMSLEVFRLYLMGMDPMVNRIIRKTLDMNSRPITLEKIARAVETVASFEGMLEIDPEDDFDFDSLDDLGLDF